MRISQLSVRNFRSLKDATINFEPYTCLVGPNGSGKSAIIKALNLFFYQNPEGPGASTKITAEDFHQKDTTNPIHVELVFTDLSESAKDDLSHYVRDDKLRVFTKVTYDPSAEQGIPLQHGIRPGIEEFREFFVAERDRKTVPQLRPIFAELRETHPQIAPAATKAAMIDALHQYERENPALCTLMESEEQFYGVAKGQNRLSKHIQWIYVPAVKDASSEETESRNTALGNLLQRTVRASVDFSAGVEELRNTTRTAFQSMLDEQQSLLDDLSQRLHDRIKLWAHPDASLAVRWQEDPDRSVRIDDPYAAIVAKEGSFEGHIGQFGHGLQRSFLLALLQELSNVDDAGPTLVLGCEEPELYQHPPQARHLASVLQSLAYNGDQMIVTTHNPAFIAPERPETVRLCSIDRAISATRIAQTSLEEISQLYAIVDAPAIHNISGSKARIYATLQSSIGEMLFAQRVVLVEGHEDNAYIESFLHLLGLKDEFRRLGCHIVPCNGKPGIIRPLVVCQKLGIDTIVVFDADSDNSDRNRSHGKDKRDNSLILRLCHYESPNPFPDKTFWGNSVVAWHSNISDVVRTEVGCEEWDEIRSECATIWGSAKELGKNPLFISEVVTTAWERQCRSPSLEKLCRMITTPS